MYVRVFFFVGVVFSAFIKFKKKIAKKIFPPESKPLTLADPSFHRFSTLVSLECFGFLLRSIFPVSLLFFSAAAVRRLFGLAVPKIKSIVSPFFGF